MRSVSHKNNTDGSKAGATVRKPSHDHGPQRDHEHEERHLRARRDGRRRRLTAPQAPHGEQQRTAERCPRGAHPAAGATTNPPSAR